MRRWPLSGLPVVKRTSKLFISQVSDLRLNTYTLFEMIFNSPFVHKGLLHEMLPVSHGLFTLIRTAVLAVV